MQIIVTIITFTSSRHHRCFANCIDINLLDDAGRHSGINYHACVCILFFSNNTVYKICERKKKPEDEELRSSFINIIDDSGQ